ncbi:MAG: alpha-L-fucosidase [Bacteroidales bacterium]|nr:alpha-L-fucosidase [Bacteroidales bacterium]
MKKSVKILLFLTIVSINNLSYSQQSENFPSWFDSVKLGIMIHYGLYSVPSYSDKEQYAEWFYKGLISGDSLRINFQKHTYGENFSYFDYMHLFKSELFDADSWLSLFKKSGAKYIVFSSKHHDGFCLWDTKTTNKNSMHTPAGRDFLKELKQACTLHDIRFGVYYSLMEWDNPYFRWTIDSEGLDDYVDKYMLVQFKELVDLYQPSIVFADGDWDFDYKALRSSEMIDYLEKKVGRNEVIVNNRWGIGNPYGFLTPEYSDGIKEKNRPWSECRSLGRSFGLNRNSSLEDYLSAEELIKHFIKLVSLGGGLMLNVAPAADGQIPLLQQERLLQLGEWIDINKQAVYGSKPWYKSIDMTPKTEYIYSPFIDFDWVRNSPVKHCTEDNFSIDWENEYTPQKNETLTFILNADDEAEISIFESKKLKYNGKAVKDKELEFSFDFQKSKVYTFVINYKEKDVDAHLHFMIKDKKGNTSAFTTNKQWKGNLSWQQPVVCYTTNGNNLYAICLEELSDNFSFPLEKEPQRNMNITLLGSDVRNLPWQYHNGILTIDLSHLTLKDVKCKYACVFRLENYLKE